MRKMSVQHTNLDTSQDKGQTGQEVKRSIIKSSLRRTLQTTGLLLFSLQSPFI